MIVCLMLALALLGYGLFWAAVVNRLHGRGMPRRLVKWLTVGCFVAMCAIPAAILGNHAARSLLLVPPDRWPSILREIMAAGGGTRWLTLATAISVVACQATALAAMVLWTYRSYFRGDPGVQRAKRSTRVIHPRAQPAIAESALHFLCNLPGNQALHLDLTERVLAVPRLPRALDGMSIVHVSDFHFTGHIGKEYYREIARRANALDADLVALTGDFIDRRSCLDWAGELLGAFRARHGVYFVLGNHDRVAPAKPLREALAARGLMDLGGRWVEIVIRGERVILAGNELPWFHPAADLTACPPPPPAGPLRILLSHSPDQFAWAQSHDFDLMLAGHTHGGQIRLPWIGPLLAPSREGVRYASGLFHAPPTVMHVTRGVAGELPLRLNCAPEMARLVLHAAM